MLIREVIQSIKNYSRGTVIYTNTPIDGKTTRDKVLYGSIDKECTGIVTTCFASVEVIKKAHELGYNLIIPHEALFWNHGDHTDWLMEKQNKVFLRKKELLDEYGITVWRDHDYIHSGIPDGNGGWFDGIFKGFLNAIDMEKYYVKEIGATVQYNKLPVRMIVPEGIKVKDLAQKIIKGANLNGIRLIGDPELTVHSIGIPMHCLGRDEETITAIDSKGIECLITMELIDYTTNIYMRDGIQLGDTKAILAVGHFNVEEPGMQYMINWLPKALAEDIPMTYIQSGDMNKFIVR